jgi:hypothetical protein
MTTKRTRAHIIQRATPIAGRRVHGVTYDGKLVWYAADTEIVGYDPEADRVAARITVPATAGTAYDGRYFYQIAGGEILVVDRESRIVRRVPAPSGTGDDSGMAYADGYLWVGQYKAAKIHQIDAQTGEIVKTLTSDRYVTGVSCVDGDVWHGVGEEGGPPELRALAPDGSIREVIQFVGDVHIAGVESDGKGGFWCGADRDSLMHVRRGAAL